MIKRILLFVLLATLTISFVACKKSSVEISMEMESGGTFIIHLFPKDAPKTVNNFVKLVNESFYNGLQFHRVLSGELVQGGDPKGDGTGGPGYQIKFENSGLKHKTGSVAMARKTSSQKNEGSQFYICLKPQQSFDAKFTVFGKVISGMDVVQNIKRGDKIKKAYVSSH
ncbi:peptidylprolyl isomerase [Thermodesulfobacteriota bacterium]